MNKNRSIILVNLVMHYDKISLYNQFHAVEIIYFLSRKENRINKHTLNKLNSFAIR